MRWPDLFFKSRKPKVVPEIVTVPPRVVIAEAAKAATAKSAADKIDADKTDKEKAESLRALTESGSIRVPPRIVKDLPPANSTSAGKPAEIDKSNAKTAVLPAVSRASSVSLRQLAKLTDDAHRLPKPEDATPAPPAESSPKPPEPSAGTDTETSGSGAVVPAAFPVAVEAGTVLDNATEKVVGDSTPPTEAKIDPSAETSPAPEKAATESPDAKHDAPEAASSPPRDTARVHVGHSTTSAPSTVLDSVKPSTDTREKQEFVLANGERIIGHVLSETPQTIYLDHGTLGVLTLPRSQIANKPIEVILINGDRIVGDLIAETPECLYIKHASLGMVTVPHGQRSARVVEAILKDGDRILGEVLAETEDFTVIRSATLGTVAVQHEQVAMLNRKIEQMQLRSLPAPTPAIEDKTKS
jgi:RNase P/RNase MRP subunit p29